TSTASPRTSTARCAWAATSGATATGVSARQSRAPPRSAGGRTSSPLSAGRRRPERTRQRDTAVIAFGEAGQEAGLLPAPVVQRPARRPAELVEVVEDAPVQL